MTSCYSKSSLTGSTFQSKPSTDLCRSRIRIRDVQPSGFHNLPTKVLLQIFRYIPEDDLRKTIIPVCHKWRQVALLPELWQIIKFQGFNVPSSFICEQLRTFRNLQSIYLIEINEINTVIRQICRYNTQIENITIKKCRNDKIDEKIPERVLRNILATCKNLKKINLKGTQFSANLFYIEAALLPFLKSIDLSNNEYLTTKNIFEFVLNSQQLEEFKLSCRKKNQYMTDNDALFLFSNLKYSLKSIVFDMMDLTNISFKTLLECDKLEKLYLYNASNISSELFGEISKNLANLRHLKIHHSQISARDIKEFCRGNLENLSKLQSINLAGSWKLNSKGLNILAKYCPNIEKAVFRCCKNLENINSLLENCKKLQILDISFCLKLPDENILDASIQLHLLKKIYVDLSRKLLIVNMKSNNSKLIIYIYLSEFNKTLKSSW